MVKASLLGGAISAPPCFAEGKSGSESMHSRRGR